MIIQTFIKIIIKARKQDDEVMKMGMIVLIIFSIAVIVYCSVLLRLYCIFEFSEEEYITERNGKKMIVLVNSFTSTNIKYYDYKNMFVRGNELKENFNIQEVDKASEILKMLRESK